MTVYNICKNCFRDCMGDELFYKNYIEDQPNENKGQIAQISLALCIIDKETRFFKLNLFLYHQKILPCFHCGFLDCNKLDHIHIGSNIIFNPPEIEESRFTASKSFLIDNLNAYFISSNNKIWENIYNQSNEKQRQNIYNLILSCTKCSLPADICTLIERFSILVTIIFVKHIDPDNPFTKNQNQLLKRSELFFLQ